MREQSAQRLAQWGQRATTWLRGVLGVRPQPNGSRPVPTSETTEATLLENLEPGALRAASGEGLRTDPSAGSGQVLAGLEKQIARLGREQFKLNALIEKQQQQAQSALEQLREQDERREKEYVELAARRQAEQAEARLQVIQRVLPVLDGLDEALASGEGLLERVPSPLQILEIGRRRGVAPPRPDVPWWENTLVWPVVLMRLIFPGRSRGLADSQQQRRELAALAADMAAWEDAYLAWLRGLELVRERLLETLALEGVEPIEAVGEPFDPHRHVAMDTAPAQEDTPPGDVVAELRRGYVAGDRVLRYAEVVVARADATLRAADD